MQKVGSRELKNRLGRYLRNVKNGGAILVTDRGKPVAKIVPADGEANQERGLEERLRQLEAEGHFRLATKPFKRWKLVTAKGKPASQMIIEDRR